jgi:hypothetical protein
VWVILHAAGIDPAPRRVGPMWWWFLTLRAHTIIACDFLTVETVLLKRLHVLVFIEHRAATTCCQDQPAPSTTSISRFGVSAVGSGPEPSIGDHPARGILTRLDPPPRRQRVGLRPVFYPKPFQLKVALDRHLAECSGSPDLHQVNRASPRI